MNWLSFLQPITEESGFQRVAQRLLNGCCLIVADQPQRLVEIEFYLYSPDHPDPFTHRDVLQQECGRWYFHRNGGTYRGGSFKGLDLTFGSVGVFGGILLRALATPNDELIAGPSLLVDHLLKTTGLGDIAALDDAVSGRAAWDSDNPLRLEEANLEQRPIYSSGRVGLTLKRASAYSDMPGYILRPYRFLTEPRGIAKGKLLLVLALHAQGMEAEAIHQLTGCPRKTIQRYVADFEAGRAETDPNSFNGIEMTPADLCKLHGAFARR